MNQFGISYDDVVRLKHLRNVGEYVAGVTALQDCYEKPAGAWYERLVSLIYLMTKQPDGAVRHCHDGLMNAEIVRWNPVNLIWRFAPLCTDVP